MLCNSNTKIISDWHKHKMKKRKLKILRESWTHKQDNLVKCLNKQRLTTQATLNLSWTLLLFSVTYYECKSSCRFSLYLLGFWFRNQIICSAISSPIFNQFKIKKVFNLVFFSSWLQRLHYFWSIVNGIFKYIMENKQVQWHHVGQSQKWEHSTQKMTTCFLSLNCL